MDELYDDMDDVINDIVESPKLVKLKKENEEAFERLRAVAKNVLSTPDGRKFLWWILDIGMLFQSTYNGRALDQAHKDGMRGLAAEVWGLALRADRHIYAKMLNEKLNLEGKE